MISSTDNLRIRRFVLAGTMLSVIIAILFMGAGGGVSGGGGADPNSSSACTVGNFARNVTESSGSLIVQCSSVGWTQLTGFPSPCPANQFVTAVGASLTCSAVSWTGLTSFPAGCSAGQFVTGVGLTLTCAATAAGSPENGRFSVTYPFATIPGLLGSTSIQDVTAFTLGQNRTLKVWYGAGFANGTSGSGTIVFGQSATSSVPATSRITDTVTIPVTSGQAIVVTPYPENRSTLNHVVSVTDNDTNPYTFRGAVSYPGVPGLNLMEIWTTFAATTTTLKINVTYSVRTCCYVEVSTYSGVGSFGATVSHSSTYAGSCSIVTPCTETATLTGGLASHVLAGSEIWHDCADTQTEGTGQTVRSGPSACQTVGGTSIMGRTSDRPEVTGTDTYSFSLTSCTSCYTGVIAIDLIPGLQSQGFIQVYDSTIHSLLYSQNIIVVPTAGDPLGTTALFSRYFPVGHVITFRIAANSASALTISGTVLISIPNGNV